MSTGFGLSSTSSGQDAVEGDLERRTQSFVRRDREFKTKIELLEAEIAKVRQQQLVSDLAPVRFDMCNYLQKQHCLRIAGQVHIHSQPGGGRGRETHVQTARPAR